MSIIQIKILIALLNVRRRSQTDLGLRSSSATCFWCVPNWLIIQSGRQDLLGLIWTKRFITGSRYYTNVGEDVIAKVCDGEGYLEDQIKLLTLEHEWKLMKGSLEGLLGWWPPKSPACRVARWAVRKESWPPSGRQAHLAIVTQRIAFTRVSCCT